MTDHTERATALVARWERAGEASSFLRSIAIPDLVVAFAEVASAPWPWQPIETAPRTEPIVLTDGMMLWFGFWQDGMGWLTGCQVGPLMVTQRLEPTHWTQLPLPPTR